MEFSYSYCDGTKNTANWIHSKTANPNEVKILLDKLTEPKRGVSISFGLYPEPIKPDWVDVNFHVFENIGIEMEIMPYGDDKNFAHVDISTAKQIVDAMFELSDIKFFREKLRTLQIKWIC
jgi:hypothetical protein